MERPRAVTHGAAAWEGARRCTQRYGAIRSALGEAWKVDRFVYGRKDRLSVQFCVIRLNAIDQIARRFGRRRFRSVATCFFFFFTFLHLWSFFNMEFAVVLLLHAQLQIRSLNMIMHLYRCFCIAVSGK